jgi:tetratricopeptide (TPR) repeat protein
MPESAFALDPENPWPGLYAYGEEHTSYFHGRETETDELARRVRGKNLTILFGQSGLGKSSLIRAGLFPRLRIDGFEPHLLRFVFDAGAAPIRLQVREQLGAPDAVSLARCLDIRGEEPKLATGPKPIPVLVFDQFEELFTRGSERPEGRKEVTLFLRELADLVENRPTAGEASIAPLFRIVIAMREDYLAQLESWRGEMPSLVENRMRLTSLNGQGALRAVTRPASLRGEPPLIGPTVARQVVRFLAGHDSPREAEATAAASWEDFASFELDPALLSLVLRELNDERRLRGLDQITVELLGEMGDVAGILRMFYQRALTGEAPAVRVLVEEELLTDAGFRDNVSVGRAERFLLDNGGEPAAIERLVQRRLLRVEERLEQRRLELAHDVLCRILTESRNTRQREEAEHAAQVAAERAKEEADLAASRLAVAEAEREKEVRARAESDRLRSNAEAATRRARGFAIAALLVALYAGWQWREARQAKIATKVLEQKIEKIQSESLAFDREHSLAEERPQPEAIAALKKAIALLQRVEKEALVKPNSDTDREIRELLGEKNLLEVARGPTADGTVANVEELRNRARELDRVGEQARDNKNFEEALKAYGESMAIRTKLAPNPTDDAELRFDVSISHNNIGNVYFDKGEKDDFSKALSEFEAALAIRDSLAVAYPKDTRWQRAQFFCLLNISATLQNLGENEKALKTANKAQAIIDAVAASERDNPRLKGDQKLVSDQIVRLLTRGTYRGKAGPYDGTFELLMEPGGRTSGIYVLSANKNLILRLEGRYAEGKLSLDEYTRDRLTAHIVLTIKISANEIRWEGTMNNTPPDNRVFPVSFARSRQ